MRSSRVDVNVRMPQRQKSGILRLAEGFDQSASAYARMAVDVCLGKPELEAAVKKALRTEARNKGTEAQFRFALGKDQYGEVLRRADSLGVTAVAYLRALLSIPCVPAKEGVPEPEVVSVVDTDAVRRELRAIRTELARIGNNVNQIAYGINLMNKKSWLSAREAGSLFGAWRESTAKAQAEIEAVEDAVEAALAGLSAAERGHIVLGGGGGCRK